MIKINETNKAVIEISKVMVELGFEKKENLEETIRVKTNELKVFEVN